MAGAAGRQAIAAGLAAALLAGCAQPREPDAGLIATALEKDVLAGCCAQTDSFPPELVALGEGSSLWALSLAHRINLRAPYLQDRADALDFFFAQARPLDIVLLTNRARLTGASAEGYFGHSAVYLGGEADLRALGVWDHPLVMAQRARFRAGAVAIEAIGEDVHLSTRRQLMAADAAALLRPTAMSRAQKQAAVLALIGELGKPFDHHFDLDTPGEVFCTELINTAMPGLGLPVRESYGRRTIWPDEIATRAFAGKVPLGFVTYLRGDAGGWKSAGSDVLAARILAAWR